MESSKKYEGTYIGKRNIGDYCSRLDFDVEYLDIPGEKILDLGSGLKQNLAREARELGLKAEIYSTDPNLQLSEEEELKNELIMPKYVTDEDKATRRHERSIGRSSPEKNTFPYTADRMNFPDNFFDKIIALYSVPYYIYSSTKPSLLEIIRVLKKGGEARFFPIANEDHLEEIKELEKEFKNISVDYHIHSHSYLLILKKNSD